MGVTEAPVLIVGAGPVGLAAALLLARSGVRSLLVERHPATSLHPKARLVNARTMEILRQCGLEPAVRAAALPPAQARYLLRARSLAGEELDRREATFTAGLHPEWSPTDPCACAQNDLEPLLLAAARETGLADIRFDTEMLSFAQDAAGVAATLRDRAADREWEVRVRYLIGADGVHSTVRQSLGIPMAGRAGLNHTVSILFRADLTPWAERRPFYLCFIANPAAPGTLLTINGTDRWAFGALYDPAKGERAEDYTPERCVAAVRAAVGVADLPVEILGVAPYIGSALIAARYREGRAFLAGDAAHETTPAGGFGMNTGIQDAHNLAWKLAAVLGGWADPALLDTYEGERLPVGRAVVEQSRRNTEAAMRGVSGGATAPPVATGAAGVAPPRPELLGEWGLIFGLAYDSPAVVPDGTPPPAVADPVRDYAPTARPGHRAPHVWLARDGARRSTLDLFDTGFTLLAGPAGRGWRAAAATMARTRGVPLAAHAIGAAGDLVDADGGWSDAYGVAADGAVLVRPDGYVAWRARTAPADPREVLDRALDRALGGG